MLDRNGKLEIFDNFVVDRRLPKFKAGRKELGTDGTSWVLPGTGQDVEDVRSLDGSISE